MESEIFNGDALKILKKLPAGSVQTCVTSPPYWGLRDYGSKDQLGQESLPKYIRRLTKVFDQVFRVLKNDGTLWLNLGDTYIRKPQATLTGEDHDGIHAGREARGSIDLRGIPKGLKPKDLAGIPWRMAFALQARGWFLRSDIIWSKPNPMPESCTDRPSRSHEYIFLMSKSGQYKYNGKAIQDPLSSESLKQIMSQYKGEAQKDYLAAGAQNASDVKRRVLAGWAAKLEAGEALGANKKTVWSVPTANCAEAHFATFPTDLIKPCIMAGSEPGDTVLDPFNGTGTTGLVSLELGRNYQGIEINPFYVGLTETRLRYFQMDLFERPENVSNQNNTAREKAGA